MKTPKNLFLSFLVLSSLSTSAAGFFDSLNPSARAYVEAGIRLFGSSSQGSSYAKVEAAGTEDLCLSKLEDSKERWAETAEKESLAGFIYLQYPLYNEEIKNLTTSINDIPANSWNPVTAPHLDSQCGKFWVEEKSELIEDDDKLCKVSTLSYSNTKYDIIACAGENEIFIDLNSIK